MPTIKKKSSNIGVLLQLIGLVCLFLFFPLGFFVGVAMLIGGGVMARGLACSECGNKISSKDVKICPVCKADFSKKPSPQPENKNISTQRMQPATDPVKTEPDHQKKLDQKIEFKFS
jgi:hypothetical protein